MEWFFLILASFGEIFGVASINLFLKKRSLLWLGAVVFTFAFGFFFLALAMEKFQLPPPLPSGRGLGETGGDLPEAIFFRNPGAIPRLIFLPLLTGGVVG